MIKQEQSEKIVYGSLITSTKCYNCIHFPLCFEQKGAANLEFTSENNCCYYQSKLPEDSVVLSGEELKEKYVPKSFYELAKKVHEEKVEELENLINHWIENWKQASKETAEKIYLQAKAIVDATKHIVQGREYIHIDALKEIIKNCGGEIEE